MAKYLLASASGMGFLCLIAGLSPVQALPNLEIADKNVAVNQNDSSYQKNDSHQSNLKNSISNELLIVNENQKNQDLGVDSAVKFQQQLTPQSANSSPSSDKLAQVTSVSQLSDVQPTDWAFQALQSLVERYGCIAGYPNQTYRGNRAMTRYEFAAGLNACLERINELIATATGDLVKKEDLATLQKLQEQFTAELTTLRGRVDAVEARTAKLEANQFSTTTKLNGEVIIAGVGATGGASNNSDSNIILVNRVRLNLTTSFTGKDLLLTGLQAYNFLGGANGQGSLQQSLGLAAPLLSSSSARTSFEPQFPGLNVNTLSSVGANDVQLYKLLYIFPVANKLTLFAGTAAETSDAFPTITPFYGEGQESISRFAGLNPVLRVSGGTSGTGLASAAGFIYSISPNLDLRALYGSVNANLPQKSADEALPGVSTTPLGGGVFSGSSIVAAQLTFKPSPDLDIGLNYANSYHEINILGTGLISGDVGALAGVDAGTPVKLNSFGGTVTWRFSPKIALSGYGAALFVDASSNSVNASTTFTSWMVGVHFKDLFKSGNNAGIIFGQPLYRSDAGGSAQLSPTGDNRATPYHLEGYYRFRVSDNISITPGAFILFNPEGNSNNETTTVGVLRTTFTF
ncbi:iron uptake porin [Nostoc sp. 'Peltigera membranacea cyanobiont' 232]|uniref:iron uptake porin n=1 Tax=Nostoc sp. 'Peltigera membranacea cyanobiont' 232 TaxID=2014531 RepID=UPI000B958FC8|nr:iron uptake porin [Nostoc sp. 'Peltigera membranacea cyanobiont' 232]OYE01515.1 S-layer protein [Nostoc sp. 'Peltigera membranacea cyanobiont' 232]